MRERITVSLPPAQVAAARASVERGTAESVSDYVSQAIAAYGGEDTSWDEVVQQILAETGGPLTAEEIEFADGLVDGSIDGMLSFEEWSRGRGHHA